MTERIWHEPTAEDWQKLQAPFAPDEIEKKPQGKVMLDYVGHAGITTRLNNVCGPDQWDWQPMAWEDDGTPKFNDGGLWINLTVWGVSKIGYGDPGSSSGPNAVKEMIGDALRNAAMRFGVGTYLWSKSERALSTKAGVAEAEPDPTPRQQAWDFLSDAFPDLETPARMIIAERALNKRFPGTFSGSDATADQWAAVLADWKRDGIDQPSEDAPPDPEAEARPDDAPTERMISAGQLKALHAGLSRLGIKEDAKRHEWLSTELDTNITSAKQVTYDEASYLIDKLKQAGA